MIRRMTTPPTTPDEQADEARDGHESDPLYRRTRTRTLYIGAAILLAAMLGIFIPMLIAVGRGISSGEVWDPYTKEQVGGQSACVEQARSLLVDAGKGVDATWTARHTSWISKCEDAHPELGAMLKQTAK